MGWMLKRIQREKSDISLAFFEVMSAISNFRMYSYRSFHIPPYVYYCYNEEFLLSKLLCCLLFYLKLSWTYSLSVC